MFLRKKPKRTYSAKDKKNANKENDPSESDSSNDDFNFDKLIENVTYVFSERFY